MRSETRIAKANQNFPRLARPAPTLSAAFHRARLRELVERIKYMKSKWIYFGDANSRCIGKRQFQFVELVNMDDACGRDNKGQPKYVVELRLVDLNVISQSNLNSALSYCGQEHVENPSDEILAECCNRYGCNAPLGSWSGNNARKLLRQAYREANSLLDSEALETRLDRPVNKIGSSAREVMAGDFTSAMIRGCESGNTDARIMAKIHGVPQEAIDNTRPDDWLPYMFGYMAGLNSQPKETDPDTASEYFRGYDRGVNVREGKAPAPAWIQSASVPA